MPASSDDNVEEEYLDDLISLVTFEGIKTEKCDSDKDQIIDLGESTDEESTSTSSYGKKHFVLPVTFFDISRNVRLLSKCKPMSIRIVDCKQHPSYYSKYISEKGRNQPEDSGIEVFSKTVNDKENEPNNDKTECNDTIKDNTDKIRDKVKKRSLNLRGDSFYEKWKRRKERRKENALKCRDLSRVDFKRNKGLVGLKITGNIFKKIVDTERALRKVKRVSSKNKCKDKCGSDREKSSNDTKTYFTNGEYKEDGGTNTKVITTNCNHPDDKCEDKGNKLTTSIETNADLKSKDRTETDTEKAFIGTESHLAENKSSGVTSTQKITIETKNDFSEDTCKENANFNTEKPNSAKDVKIYSCKEESTKITLTATTKNNSIDNIYSEKRANNSDVPSLKTKSPVPKLDENYKSSTYLTQIGSALDNLGTSIIAIDEDNINNNVPKNIHIDGNNAKYRVEVGDSPAIDKSDNNNENNKIRCSLKISCKKIIEKALKLKQTKHNETPPDMSNAGIGKHPREVMKNDELTVQKLNLKRNNHEVENLHLVSNINKKHSKSQKSTSSKSKRVEKSTTKNAKDGQAGSNSPVLPCTTITFRSAQPKSSSVMSINKNLHHTQKQNTGPLSISLTSNQKKPQTNDVTSVNKQTPYNAFVTNQASLSKAHNARLASSKNIVSNKNSSIRDENSSLNCTVKDAGRKYPHIFIRTGEPKSSVSGLTVTENRLLNQDLSHRPINGSNSVMTMTKSATTGNATAASNQTTNGVIKYQANPNPQATNRPSFIGSIRPSYSGHNAIIFRRPPASRHLQKNVSPIRGQAIETVVNHRFQNQTYPAGGGPGRFQAPPRCIPPNTNVASSASPAWLMNQRFIPQSGMPLSYMRGIETGLQFCKSQFPEYPFPTDLRPPPPPPKPVLRTTSAPSPTPRPSPMPAPSPLPPTPSVRDSSIMPPLQNSVKMNLAQVQDSSVSEVSRDSVIGSTSTGELIKKINIVAMPAKIVSDKEIMLAELNNAVMSPELTINDPEDKAKEIALRQPDDYSTAAETSKPKYSKPCPLSKKIKYTDNVIPEKLSQNVGYSPAILPILSYEEILSQSEKYKEAALKSDTRTVDNKRDNTTQKRKNPHAASIKQYKAKKISFEDYRKRVSKDDVDRIDVSKIRKAKNVADDYNQDQGYDSDSTVKL